MRSAPKANCPDGGWSKCSDFQLAGINDCNVKPLQGDTSFHSLLNADVGIFTVTSWTTSVSAVSLIDALLQLVEA